MCFFNVFGHPWAWDYKFLEVVVLNKERLSFQKNVFLGKVSNIIVEMWATTYQRA